MSSSSMSMEYEVLARSRRTGVRLGMICWLKETKSQYRFQISTTPALLTRPRHQPFTMKRWRAMLTAVGSVISPHGAHLGSWTFRLSISRQADRSQVYTLWWWGHIRSCPALPWPHHTWRPYTLWSRRQGDPSIPRRFAASSRPQPSLKLRLGAATTQTDSLPLSHSRAQVWFRLMMRRTRLSSSAQTASLLMTRTTLSAPSRSAFRTLAPAMSLSLWGMRRPWLWTSSGKALTVPCLPQTQPLTHGLSCPSALTRLLSRQEARRMSRWPWLRQRAWTARFCLFTAGI